METNMVNWFEIPVTDLSRAKKFYRAVFGQELTDANMPGLEMAMFPWKQGAPHAAGALLKAEGLQPSRNATCVYFLL
jgi:predicted enzyme related to lactoylglutathione lyase